MAILHRLFVFFSFTVLINSIVASSSTGDWETVAATLRSTLDVLQISHEQYLTQHSRRDPTFRTGPAGYWQPLSPSQHPDPSEDFSHQLNDLIGEIGSAVEQLIDLLASQFNLGGLLSSVAATSIPAPTPTILPITNLNTLPTTLTIATSHVTTTATPSLIPDRPLTTSIPLPPPTASKTYTFNPLATDLNVVYYSQTDLTPVISLTQVCTDPTIDIIVLAFVTSLVSTSGYPSMNMASNCWAPNAAQQAAGATGLLDCVGDGFASKIAQCQALGKKVLISLGGSTGDLTMQSQEQAVSVANTLWSLFLGGSDPSLVPLRPYGNVVLDGIDIDNELPSASTYLPTIVSTLRQLMSNTTTSSTSNNNSSTGEPKAYYISAAPQCPRPDMSIPVPQLLPYVDFFSVQFYNNPSCQLNAPDDGFFTALQAWSNDLLAITPASASTTAATLPATSSNSMSRINRQRQPQSRSTHTNPVTFQTINNAIPSPAS